MSYIPKNLNTSTYIRPASNITLSPTLPIETRTIETRTLPIESRVVDTRVRAASPILKKSVVHIESAPIEPRVETRISSAVLRKTNINVDGALGEIKRRYEEEARVVQQNYEIDYNNRVALVKTIEELEIVAEEERLRANDFENKYNAAMAELEKERRIRADVEHENTVLKEELMRFEAIIRESETTITRLQQEFSHIENENHTLKHEINRLTDLYNSKLKELEDKYIIQIREMDGEINSLRTALDRQRAEFESRFREMSNEVNNLRGALDKQRAEYENRLVSLDRDWSGKCVRLEETVRDWSSKYARLEETVREKDRRIADLDRHVAELSRHVEELENEIRRLLDYVSQLKMEFEEELRRQIITVREEEAHRYQATLQGLQGLEARLHQAEVDRENLARKNQDLVRELNNKERQLQDLRHQLEGEIARLRAEVSDLGNRVNSLTIDNENLKRELANREMAISRLEGDLANLEREIARIKELHTQEMTRLVNEQNNERRRWEETERALRARITEMESIIRGLETENGKLRADLERLKGNLADNLHKTLMQTFVTYETSPTYVVKSQP